MKSVAEKLYKANNKIADKTHLKWLEKTLTGLNNSKTVASTQQAKVHEHLNMFRERTSQMVAEAEAASKQALAAGVNVTRNFDNLVALMRDRLQPGGALDTLETSALEEFAIAKASATARLKTAAARSKAAVGAALNKKRSPPDQHYPDKKQATQHATQHDPVAMHELQTKLAVMEAEKEARNQAELERKERNDETTAERKEQYLQLMAAKVDAEGARASHEAFKDGQTSVAALQAQQQPPPPYQQQQQPPPPYQPLYHQQLVYEQPQTMYQPHQPQLLQQQTQMPHTPQPLLLNEPMQGPPLQPPQTHPPAQLLENNQQQQPSQQPSQQMYPPLPTPTQQSTQQQLQLYQPQPYQPQQHQHQQYQPQQPPPLFYPPHQQPQQQPYQQHPQNQQPQYLQTQQPQQQQQQHQHQQYQPYQQPPPLFYPPHQQPQQQHPQNQQPQALQQQQPHQQPQPHQPPP